MKKLTTKEFIERYSDDDNLLMDRVIYINDSSKVEVGCMKCGNYRYINPSTLRNKRYGCPYCGGSNITANIIKKKALLRRIEYFEDNKLGVNYNPSDDYKYIFCKRCGYRSRLKKPSLECVKCKYNNQWFIDKLFDVFKGEITLFEGDYVNANTKVEIHCNRCNKNSRVKPSWLFYTKKCPHCNNTRSSGYSKESIDLFDILTDKSGFKIRNACNNSEYRIRYYDQENKRRGIKVDGYIKELNLVLEYNGDCYHGNPNKYKDNDRCHPYDKNVTAKELFSKTVEKQNLIKALGYNLIVIWEYDYLNNKDLIIRNILEEIRSMYENSIKKSSK